jgi:hypothetical protein
LEQEELVELVHLEVKEQMVTHLYFQQLHQQGVEVVQGTLPLMQEILVDQEEDKVGEDVDLLLQMLEQVILLQ